MKSPTRIETLRLLAVFLLLTAAAWAMTVAQVPQRPQPPRLVNDLAGILVNPQALEDTLERFAHTTSNQIAVVTIEELGGYGPQELAYAIGEKWGVGDKRFNNGVVVLIKPKTKLSKGQVFIATGYGVEGVLPDAVCRRIIEDKMIPAFRNDNYEGGVWDALSVIMPLVKGEYSVSEYLDDQNEEMSVAESVLIILFYMFIIYLIVRQFKDFGGGASRGGRSTGTWGGPIIFGSGRGGGSFGGGGSSWGGFGGGSFGGGGAGGSW